MKQHIFLVVLIQVGIINGLLVVGPSYIRSNQNYNLAIANFNHSKKIELMIRIEGSGENGTNVLNLSKSVQVRPDTNHLESFHLPHLHRGNYKLVVDGLAGFDFYQYTDLMLLNKSISGLIQLDKPVYKPGDTVNFRVIVLDSMLKPPTNIKTVNVVVQNPVSNQVGKWSAARLNVGVFEGTIEIAPSPILGVWVIKVKVDGEDLVFKTFEVKEYVLSGLNIEVYPTRVPLQEHKGVDLTISAKNVFGQPVSGVVSLMLTLKDRVLPVKADCEVHGKAKLTMKFEPELKMYEQNEESKLNFTFTEQYTNRTISKTIPITFYKSMYRAKLAYGSTGFRPGNPFMATIKIEYHNGSPAKNVKCLVELEGTDDDELEKVSDNNGEILLELMPSENANSITVTVSIGEQELLEEEIKKNSAMDFIKIALKSSVRINQPVKLQITLTNEAKFLMYYVIAKSNVIDLGFRRTKKKNAPLTLEYSDHMSPRAKILIVTIAGNTVVHDAMDIVFEEQLNNFMVEIDEKDVNPGQQLQLDIKGCPESYVALSAYDKGLLQHGSAHDLHWHDVQKIYEEFYGIDYTEHDNFQSFGLFARVSNQFKFDGGMYASVVTLSS